MINCAVVSQGQEPNPFGEEMADDIHEHLDLLQSNSNRALAVRQSHEDALKQHSLRESSKSLKRASSFRVLGPSNYIAEKSMIHINKHPVRRILESFETEATAVRAPVLRVPSSESRVAPVRHTPPVGSHAADSRELRDGGHRGASARPASPVERVPGGPRWPP